MNIFIRGWRIRGIWASTTTFDYVAVTTWNRKHKDIAAIVFYIAASVLHRRLGAKGGKTKRMRMITVELEAHEGHHRRRD